MPTKLWNLIKNIIKVHPQKSLLAVLVVIAASFLLAPDAASASFSDEVGKILGSLIGFFIWALGLILILVVKCLILIASYQDFINQQGVVEGWRIVRDIANMFFVVVLLIIAFSTILHYENYSYKKWLPKLVLMAILVNFSKTICGLLIDVAQVVMLTFVNSFKDIAGGNIISMLGIRDVITFAEDSPDSGFWAIIGAYVLGLIYMIISLVVMATMFMILVMRLVMIWIYVVLSPLAYLLSAFPGGGTYASKWWTDFTKNLIVGPVLAFFIWLSLMMLQTGNDVNYTAADNEVTSDSGQLSNQPVTVTEASRPSALIKFVLAIGMLIGGLKIAQEIGGSAGSIAGKGMSRLNKMGAMGMSAAGGFALGRAKWAGRMGLGAASGGSKLLSGMVGGDKTKLGKYFKAQGDIASSYRSDLIANLRKSKVDKRKKFLEKMGVSAGTAEKFSDTYKKNRFNQAVPNTIGATATFAAAGSAFGPIGTLVGAGVGAGVGLLAKKLGNVRDSKINRAQVEFDRNERRYNAAVASSGPSSDVAKTAKEKLDESRTKLNIYKGNSDSLDSYIDKAKAGLYSFFDDISSAAVKNTVKAADKISKIETDAKDMVKNIANDPSGQSVHGMSGSAFYGTDGQKDNHEARIRHLSADNSTASDARNKMLLEMQDSGKFDPNTHKHDKDVLLNFAKGLAATKKKGNVDMSSLAPLMNQVDALLASTTGIAAGTSIDSLKDSVISYRQTGEKGEQGTGGMYVNAFAKNKEGKNVIAADFNKLQSAGLELDASAEGMSVPPDLMQQTAKALITQLDGEIMSLKASHAAGNIDDASYNKQLGDFEAAKTRLQDPSQLKNLSLVNTQSANFGRNARLATAYHEQIHGEGVDDEEITEGLTQLLMQNQLYGRNAVTGGRHPQEIAALAKAMKDSGKSNADILASMGQEIAHRASNEGSRSERVLKKESGGETEKAFVESAHAGLFASDVKLDTAALEKSLSDLEKSFRKAKTSGTTGKMDTLFRNLGFLIRRSDMKTVKALSKLRPDKASTPLEIEIIDGAVKGE